MTTYNYKLNGRYEVVKELSRGPFGVVQLARDTHLLSRLVVIKTLPAAEGETPGDHWLREKFDEQILALDRIKHSGVVSIYDYGWTSEGEPFFVMPYIEGRSLYEVMCDGGAMELKRAARIVGQLGSVLSAAHDVGVIHGDLTPRNVMLQTFRDGEFAVLIDFGIATVEDLEGVRRMRKTTVAGTIPYMAPEQLLGGSIPATDVWALGVVAYAMVTARLPFDTDDELTLGDMQRAGVISLPKSLRPELPEAAQDVILKALSYDPAARYAHAHEMGEAFFRAVSGGEAPAPLLDYPPALDVQTVPPAPPPEKLLRRCRELFESFKEFRNPDSAWDFFERAELSAYKHCVGRSSDVDFDQLLACLCRSGREYRGQALLDVLALLASRYRGTDYRGQECEGLRSSLRQLFAQAPAAGT
ncbi:MAG: serine/threonine protein kinase [Acidobacteria bacterium]|nr:serine/threonine protein kinase [Acidobacteriota bacterium]